MMEAFGDRQQAILTALLRKKAGRTLDELAAEVGVTRPAIRQHIKALSHLGYVTPGERNATGGRPGQTYKLTEKGYNLFPKQYSWFSEVMLKAVKAEKGSEGLRAWMENLGETIALSLEPRMKSKEGIARVEEIASIMNELAYQAEPVKAEPEPGIEATNCVFHALASQHPEVCSFDIVLLAKLMRTPITHETCIVRGHDSCRFRFKKNPR